MLLLTVTIVLVAVSWQSSTKEWRESVSQRQVASNRVGSVRPNAAESDAAAISRRVVSRELGASDDDRQLWVSPTQGSPLDLHYLPAGTQLLVHVRPEALWAHPEEEKIVAALHPWGERSWQMSGSGIPGLARSCPR